MCSDGREYVVRCGVVLGVAGEYASGGRRTGGGGQRTEVRGRRAED